MDYIAKEMLLETLYISSISIFAILLTLISIGVFLYLFEIFMNKNPKLFKEKF